MPGIEGWFAREDDPDESGRGLMWRPFLLVSAGVFALDEWFDSERECQEFIRESVANRPMLPGETRA